MSGSASILRFDDVAVAPHPLYGASIWNVCFTLMPGDLLLVLLEAEHPRLPLADAAEGLIAPLQGRVLFLDEDWQGMSANHAAGLRGRIGRVFEDGGWISDLDLYENITLAQRHHSRRPEHEILQEAAGLARMFGLPGLPQGRPGTLRPQDLKKAACVRAFLGRPTLILLENPTRGIYADILAPLMNAVQSARRRGAAVLWTTGEAQIWGNPSLPVSARAKMFGSQMHALEPVP